jgi:hypothetical protein
MGKVIMLVLLALVAVVVVKPLRARVEPHVQFAFDPFYKWSAENSVNDLSGLVKQQDQLGRTIPTPREFTAFVEREAFQDNASTDPWGTPYYLVRTKTGFQIGSAGKDRVRNTPDDITGNEVRLLNQPPTRPRR